MTLLENGLPGEIDGVPIYPDFRNMIRFEQLLDDDRLDDAQKAVLGVRQLFDRLPPGGFARAADRLVWFYRRGEEPGAGGKRAAPKRAWDLTADAACIYASFLQAYGVDLTAVRFLHWWAFLALLENLPDETPMAHKMQLRTMDLKKIKDVKLRERYREMQAAVALPAKAAARPRKAESLADRVKRRHAEARRAMEGGKRDGV